jgi:hypothetical protein
LTIARLDAVSLTISWPVSSGNFTLQTAAVPNAATWINISSGINTVGANYVLTYAASSGKAFFRLQSQ